MKTALNLLTREGMVYMAFQPALTAHQYAELLDIVEHGVTAEQMREAVKQWAERQRLQISFEE
jgi:hypothetical protein